MSFEKVERTQEIIDRLKELQHDSGYSDSEIAALTGIKLTTYKNIIRSLGSGNQTIKAHIIDKLADFYDCSTDYIKCKSNEKDLNRRGEPVKKPLDFSNRDTLLYELNTYLKSDFKTLHALHFILCQTPSWRRKEYLSGFHAFAKVLMESSFMELFKERSKEDFKLLVENTMEFDKEYFNHILQLRDANQLFETANFELSLKVYLKIIYDTLTKPHELEPIARKAIPQVLWLKENWDAFPTELNVIADTLPQIQHYHFFINTLTNEELLGTDKDTDKYKDIELSAEIVSTLNNYLSTHS